MPSAADPGEDPAFRVPLLGRLARPPPVVSRKVANTPAAKQLESNQKTMPTLIAATAMGVVGSYLQRHHAMLASSFASYRPS
eukprot:scaffold575092_cov42-Prasinocladus_malaysianus.AAC.1